VSPEQPEDQDWVVIARVLGSRGNRGEIRVVSLSDSPGRFGCGGQVYLLGPAGPGARHHRFEVENAWEHGGRLILKLRGMDTISEAERWRGCDVRIPRDERLPLPQGEYYQSDLIGFEVVKRDGRRLGRVRDWLEQCGPALLDVEGEQGEEMLIPFAASICVEIDTRGKRIVVELPEGLEDLNR
jgi:16S rRNA processing protein RimM